MSVFEDKIKQNKKAFDDHEPNIGHKERFIAKLDQLTSKRPKQQILRVVLRIAAGLLIFLATGTTIYLYLSRAQNNQQSANINYPENLKSVLAYYDAESAQKVNQIEKLVPDKERAEKLKQIAINRLEDMDGSFAAIEKELIKNPDDEKIKSALINNKRKKVEVMDEILLQLDFANSTLF